MGKSLMRPGFRFHPTDVQLVMYYLKKKILGIKLDPEIIAEVNINDLNPWDLPAKSILSGDLEWYFFFSKSKKYLSGQRMNRATETGYWKGTGKDKEVNHKGRTVGMKKTLIFHVGHIPKGKRTNWVMHEYRMKDEDLSDKEVAQEAYVVCRVFEKSGLGPKNNAQYGAPYEEEDWDDDDDDDDDDERSTVTSIMTIGVLVNPNNASCSTSVINMASTEPCPSTVAPSTVVGLSGAPIMLDHNANSSGPSTITYMEDERLKDVLVNNDDMLTHGDLASILCNKDTQEVEDPKGKKVMTVSSEEDDGIDIFNELAAMSNLHDLSPDMFNMFSVEGFADDDAFLGDDLWKL